MVKQWLEITISSSCASNPTIQELLPPPAGQSSNTTLQTQVDEVAGRWRGILVLRARLPRVEIHTSMKRPQRIPGPPELHQPLQDNHNSLHNSFPSRGFYEPRVHCLCSAFNTTLPCLQECLQFVYKSIKGRKSVANSNHGRHRDTSGHPSRPSAFAPASTCFRGTPKSPIWVL